MKYLKQTIVLILAILASVNCYASASMTHDIPMYEDGTKKKTDQTTHKHRTPKWSTRCTITSEGIKSSSFESKDIRNIEVYDLSEDYIAYFVDCASFVQFIFSTEGEYEIRFYFYDYIQKIHPMCVLPISALPQEKPTSKNVEPQVA